MHTTRTIAAAVLSVSSLVAVGATADSASAAAGSKSLTVQYGAKVIKNEQFDVSGQLTTRYERQVKLQYKSGSSWKTVDTETASSTTGRFFFDDVTTSKTRSYRFYAAKSEGNGDESGKAITGKSTKVTVVSQSVKVFEIDNAEQCHPIGNTSNFDPMTVLVKFSPARPGRPVTLLPEEYTQQAGQQDTNGVESFVINPGNTRQNSSNSASTDAWHGASSISTHSITTRLTTCFFVVLG